MQDYGECTPPVEKSLVFPVGSGQRPSVPLSQLVRKLSEVEGIMPSMPLQLAAAATSAAQQGSLDEGVGDIVPPPPPSAESFETAMQSGQQRQRPKLSKLSSFECASLSSGKSELLSPLHSIMKVIHPSKEARISEK